jgi:hypothetical protein
MAFKMKYASPNKKKSFFGDLGRAVKTIPKAAGEFGSKWKNMFKG